MKKIAKILIIFLFLLLIALIILFIFFDKCLSYQLVIYSEQVAVNKMTREINEKILEFTDNATIQYDDIIRIEKTSEGKISAVKADMYSVNRLKNALDKEIADICFVNNRYEASIPIGNLLGNGLLYGGGFDINIKFRPLGKVNTLMSGELVEAGINQTLYRIAFNVDMNVGIVFPFRYIEVPMSVENVICETVIIGDVPDSFTHFDLNGDITSQDFQGYVEDYMAE